MIVWLKDQFIVIGKRITVYAIMILFFLFCWYILGIRDITLMLVIFFGSIFVVALGWVAIGELYKRRKEH